jgi:trans-aconitate methyltransferase
MLRAQARLQFPFERFLYSYPAWQSSTSIIDFGCGNGSYLELLAREFPQKRYFGIDANPEILGLARSRPLPGNISFHASLAEIKEQTIDFVLMRYVVMHLSDREAVFLGIREVLKPGAAVLIIEPDDDKIYVTPPLLLLEDAFAKVKAASKDRDLKKSLGHEMARIGLARVNDASCVISSSIDQVERNILKYIHSIIEIGLQSKLSIEQKAALLDWYLERERLVQFGFYAHLYQLVSA